MPKISDIQRRAGFLFWWNRRKEADAMATAEFLKTVDVTKGRLSQLLNADEPFGEGAAERIERAYGLPDGYFRELGLSIEQGNISHIAVDHGHIRHPPTFEGGDLTDFAVTTCVLPLLSWGEVHLMLDTEAIQKISESKLIPLATDRDRGPRSKLVEMPDDSLGPRILKGDWLEFDPDLLPAPGRIVLVKSASRIYAIRRYDELFMNQNNLSVIACCRRWYPKPEI
jgi:hypothetical protein